MIIYNLDVLLFWFGTSLLFHVQFYYCFLTCIQISQEAGQVEPPKMDGSWWRVLTKCGPLEKGMANHFSVLASRTWNSMKRQKDRTQKDEVDEVPRLVGSQYAAGDQWRNNPRKNEEMEPKQKQHPVVDASGDGSKVWCFKEQYCIGTRNQIASIHWIIEKARKFGKTSSALLILCGSQQTVKNSPRDGSTGPPYLLPEKSLCRLRSTIRTGHGTTDWFQIRKGIHQGCIVLPCLFNFYAEYIMQNAGLDEIQAGIKIARRNNQ